MSLKYALLASLEAAARSGYDIAREFTTGVGYFWHARHQQIYRELARMVDAGEVVFETVAQQGRPAKKLYRITTAGEQALCAWLQAPAAEPVVRNELLVKLYVGHLAPPGTLLAEIRRHQARAAARLAEYRALEERYFGDPTALPESAQYIYLTLRRGISSVAAWLEWAAEVETFLTARAAAAASPAPHGGRDAAG
ncbi:MAG: PadR family transcriptional regulator [Gammaproteobacteria bacterium]